MRIEKITKKKHKKNHKKNHKCDQEGCWAAKEGQRNSQKFIKCTDGPWHPDDAIFGSEFLNICKFLKKQNIFFSP
jgi:hypothetical protein